MAGRVFYLDFSTIKKTAIGYRVWRLSNYANINDGIYSSKSLTEYDCNEESYRVLQLIGFSKPMGEGALMANMDSPQPWNYVIPGSVADDLLKTVCLMGKSH